MKQMSKTPRTDNAFEIYTSDCNYANFEYVSISFARQLETDLNEAKEAIKQLLDAYLNHEQRSIQQIIDALENAKRIINK